MAGMGNEVTTIEAQGTSILVGTCDLINMCRTPVSAYCCGGCVQSIEIKPCFIATTTASVRALAFSLRKIEVT